MADWAVPLGIGTICVICAWLLLIPGRMKWPYLISALILTGVSGLLNGSIGPWIHDRMTQLNTWAGQWSSEWTGIVPMLGLSLIVIGCAIMWVWQKQWDLRTFGAVGMVPILVTNIPGAIGGALINVVGVVPMAVTALFKALFGW